MDLYAWILTLAITAGQLIKLPVLNSGGVTILDLVVIFLCFLGLFKAKLKLKKPSRFLISAFIFISIAVLSLILTPLHLSVPQYLTSFLYTVRFGSYILLCWEIYSGVYPTVKKYGSDLLIISGIILAILGLLQLIFIPDLRFLTAQGWDPHYFRTVSTFLDPNFLGGFFVLTLILLVNKLNKTKLNLILFILVYIALLTTFSRGTYLSFLISFLSLSFLNKSFKLGLLTIILTAGLFFGYTHYQKSIATPRNIDRTQSAEFRISTWMQGLSLFQESPILGVGYNSYRYGLKQYHLAGQDFLQTHGSSSNDSSLLFIASTTGIIGFIFYLFFLFTMLYQAWQSYIRKKLAGKILIAGLLGILIQSFFANTLFYPFILIWLILISTKLFD